MSEAKYTVESGWLVEVVDYHTCGAGDYGQHEPTCGMLPIALVEDLLEDRAKGWDEGVDAAFRGAITRQDAEDVKRNNPHRTQETP